MTQTKIQFSPQLEFEFPNTPPLEMNGKKELDMVEVCKIFKISRIKMSKLLFNHKIFLYEYGRYLPKKDFTNKNYFKIRLVPSQYIGNVPKVIVCIKGFNLIKELIAHPPNGKQIN